MTKGIPSAKALRNLPTLSEDRAETDYGNGYTLTVGTNKVMGSGYDGKSDEENARTDRFLGALDSLIHFGDQQYFGSMIDKDLTGQILKFLQGLGVDTSREFIVNETRCEVRDGRIHEVGNKTGVPNSVYDKALARYEEALEMPLAKIKVKQNS